MPKQKRKRNSFSEVRNKQKEEDRNNFKSLILGMLYQLEDKEGNALRPRHNEDFFRGVRKTLHDILNLNMGVEA